MRRQEHNRVSLYQKAEQYFFPLSLINRFFRWFKSLSFILQIYISEVYYISPQDATIIRHFDNSLRISEEQWNSAADINLLLAACRGDIISYLLQASKILQGDFYYEYHYRSLQFFMG